MPINWNTPIAPKNPKYERVVLAYIDILGFSNALEDNKRLPKRIFNVLTKLYEILYSDRSGYIKTRFISDSFLIWGEAGKITLGFILELCGKIETTALLNGFLVRGGITCDRHYSKQFSIVNFLEGSKSESIDEIILSPALIQAVRLEKNKKNWRPGIRIDKSVMKYVTVLHTPPKRKRGFSFLGPFYWSELMVVEADQYNSPSLLSKEIIRRARKDLRSFHKSIQNGLKNDDKKVVRKWRVVAKQYNGIVKKFSKRLNIRNEDFKIRI